MEEWQQYYKNRKKEIEVDKNIETERIKIQENNAWKNGKTTGFGNSPIQHLKQEPDIPLEIMAKYFQRVSTERKRCSIKFWFRIYQFNL